MTAPIRETIIIALPMWGVILRGLSCYNLVKQQVRRRDMAVRLRVKEVAREKGISMGKLHRQADVSYKTIKRIYSDPYYATTTITLGKLAKVLGVPPGELIEEVPDNL
jgi:lambda repressor-like predicted transcriptional regulator